jgi:hypothetical protein
MSAAVVSPVRQRRRRPGRPRGGGNCPSALACRLERHPDGPGHHGGAVSISAWCELRAEYGVRRDARGWDELVRAWAEYLHQLSPDPFCLARAGNADGERDEERDDTRDSYSGPLGGTPLLPTRAPPGTPGKLAVLEERAEAGFELWHTDDATDYRALSRPAITAGGTLHSRG